MHALGILGFSGLVKGTPALSWKTSHISRLQKKKNVEMLGIEPRASYMQSMHSTTELHPLLLGKRRDFSRLQ